MDKLTYVQALTKPLQGLDHLHDLSAGKQYLTQVADHAMSCKNTSLWWSYIFLYETYVRQCHPSKNDVLPGFPDMDTAVKFNCPSVYNWYYHHKKIPLVQWDNAFAHDISLAYRLGYLQTDIEPNFSENEAFSQTLYSLNLYMESRQVSPMWLTCTWSKHAYWPLILEAAASKNTPNGLSIIEYASTTALERWQWSCASGIGDLKTLPPQQAALALDALRCAGIKDSFRESIEQRFLHAFPQFNETANIAFALGAPLINGTIYPQPLPSNIFMEPS